MYHYTIGNRLPLIRKSGALLPLGAKLGVNELPQLWFSEEPIFEPSALRLQFVDRRLIRPSFEQYHAMYECYRFLLRDQRCLKSFSKVCRAAHLVPDTIAEMKQVCIDTGARHELWRGTVDTVALSQLTLEKWNGTSWVEADFRLEASRHAGGAGTVRYGSISDRRWAA